MRTDDPRLAGPLAESTGRRPQAVTPLGGGCIAEVYRVDLEGGGALVAKAAAAGGLAIEGFMLSYLAEHSSLPVPAVRHCSDTLLLMDFVANDASGGRMAEIEAGEQLAHLHGITAEAYGFERDTAIAALAQPNPWTIDWREFFRDRRLLHMGRLALDRGRLPATSFTRLEALCGKLESYLDPPAAPSLVHGDVWSGNLLVRRGRIVAYLDPAIYFADAEVELAFIALFSTLGPAFFRRYHELRPIAPGFFEARRDLYNLFPLLVHTSLFGGSYARSVENILARFT